MYTWVTSDRSAAWNWAPRVGRIICVTALRFFLVGSSSSLSSTLPPASFPPALYHRNNWTIVQVCGVKKKCASNTQYMCWKGVLTSTCHIDLVSKSSTQELLQKFLIPVTQNLASACSALHGSDIRLLTSFISWTSGTVIQSYHALSSRNFSTRGNLRVKPVLNLSLSMTSAALIY